jgi:hypothetical protein
VRLLSALLVTVLLLPIAASAPAPAAAADVDAPNSLGLDATYDVTATLKWARRKLIVSSTATVTNNTDAAVDALTFNFAPAQIGKMVLREVRVGEVAATATVRDQNVIVTLPAPLEPTQQASVTIRYKATFGRSSLGKQWLFAKLNGIVTAYRWIPWLSRGYTFVTPTFGEPFVTQVSPEVRVTLTADRSGVKFATSGQKTGQQGRTQNFVATNVRDFNFTASRKYLASSETHAGIKINYFYTNLSLASLAKHTRAALTRFTNRVGPYPYPQLTVAESHTGYAMESPGMIWIPGTTPGSNVRYLVTHEVAHQWFYGVVGNDQAREPYADEAMAEFLTRDLIGHRGSKCAVSVLDLHVYEYTKACYYEVIYVQGDGYLEAYRQRVGNDAFWAGLRLYYERYAFKLGGTTELLQTLDEVAPEGTGGGHGTRFPTIFGTGG